MKLTKIGYKSEKSLNQLIKKYRIKIERLENLKTTFYDFEIEITDIQVNMINEKIKYYRSIYQDMIRFRIWKFEYRCESRLNLYHLKYDTEELRLIKLNYLREKKLNRIIYEIPDTDI